MSHSSPFVQPPPIINYIGQFLCQSPSSGSRDGALPFAAPESHRSRRRVEELPVPGAFLIQRAFSSEERGRSGLSGRWRDELCGIGVTKGGKKGNQ